MTDFRKWFPALAVVALAFGAASTVNAQQAPAFSCVGNASNPPLVRAEGLAELVGDLILNCNGGIPTALSAPVPQANFRVYLNTNVTSRLMNSDGASEALLLIDEPTPLNQWYCPYTGNCGVTGVGTTGGVAFATGGTAGAAKNVYQGRTSGPNSIDWIGVPIDPPGSTGTRVIRITNVRANANQLGVSSTLIPQTIVMFVSVTGTTTVPINNPQQTVGYVAPGLSFSTRAVKSSYLQCVSWNKDAATDNTKALKSGEGLGLVVRFTEGFPTAFKIRTKTTFSSADSAPTPVDQNLLQSTAYNTESGFYNSSTANGNTLPNSGLADHGTRLMARFANVPAGVVLYASLYTVTSNSDPNITNAAINTTSLARLVTTDSNGGGAFSATSGTNSWTSSTPFTAATAPIALSNGAGQAVWEVVQADPSATQTYEFGIGLSYVSNTASNLPGVGSATVAGSFAPLSTVTTQSTSAPLPRFVDTSSAKTLFTMNPCTTNLLFVFLTNQAGFDSGIAISNTSLDPFGTAAQSGTCKLNYYGETTGGGAAPAAQTSAVLPAGKQLTAVLSTGGNYGIAATPGFQGYMIAQCAFQYAHGFAFISDVGANRVSEAYTALVLDKGDLSNRTGFSSEVLGH